VFSGVPGYENGNVHSIRRASHVAGDERKLGWRERRRAAKREKGERTGDSPEKRAERKASDSDVKDAAGGAAIRGTAIGGGIGGGGAGGM
jgi:hypothetical protein